MATSPLCKDRYIGMTARRLHDRALEHLPAIKNGSSTSALGDHYAKKHEEKPASVTFSILKHVRSHDVLRLHIEEAIAIKKYYPELNRSQELMAQAFFPYHTTHTLLFFSLPLSPIPTPPNLSRVPDFTPTLHTSTSHQHVTHSSNHSIPGQFHTHTALSFQLRWLGTVVTTHTASHRQAYTPVMSMLQKAVQNTHRLHLVQSTSRHTNAIMLYALSAHCMW